MAAVLKMLEKVEEQKERAVDDLIARTKYYGMPGTGHVGTEGGWGAVYKTLKDQQEHERRTKTPQEMGQTTKAPGYSRRTPN